MNAKLKRLFLLPAIILTYYAAYADVTLPSLISDNMVMQQNAPVHIWGRAGAGEVVHISILKQKVNTIAGNNGRWDVWLSPMKASLPVSMTVTGNNTIVVNNILVGEVWLASGQSNMEWDVSQSNNAEQEISNANYPLIRLFVPVKGISDTVQTDIKGKWVLCSPTTIPHFTAVGYFFGRDIFKRTGFAIGLIEAAWGATNCQSWTPMSAIDADPRLNYLMEDWQRYLAAYPDRQKAYEAELAKWKAANSNTTSEQNNKAQPVAGPRPAQMSFKDKPGVIYNAVIAPLSNYTIKGVIWYQGEANAYERVSYPYRYLFPTMIQAWRDAWKEDDLPFLFVQLSTLNKHPYWPMLRESQTETLKLKNTGMAVSIDVGDSTNAHYKDKQTIGYRLGLIARRMVYGDDIESSGPVYKQATVENDRVRIWFDHAKDLKTTDGTALKGFVIAGADGKYVTANAVIEGSTVCLSNPAVGHPLLAKYAFTDAPVVNLVNSAGLPAVPFRTEMGKQL